MTIEERSKTLYKAAVSYLAFSEMCILTAFCLKLVLFFVSRMG